MAIAPRFIFMAEESPKRTENPTESSSPDNTLREQIVEFVLKWTKPGSVGAGTAYGAWALFMESDLKKAIASLLIGTGISYGSSLLEPIHQGNQRRMQGAGTAIDRWLDSINPTRQWQLSAFNRHYLKEQSIDCREYSTEGFNPDRTTLLMLEDVFVPLRLSGYAAVGNLREMPRDRKHLREWEAATLNIWELIRRSQRDPKFRQIAIQAPGGYGKTTLLRHITLIYANGKQGKYRAPKRIPVLLRLRTYLEELSAARIPSLPQLITDRHLNTLSEKPLQAPLHWAEHLLYSGQALVMFDGFDEVPVDLRARVSTWITQQMAKYERSTFILTSRPAGYKDYTAKRPALPISVNKFNPEQQADFVRKWYLCQEQAVRLDKNADIARRVARERTEALLTQLQAREELAHMAETPLLLNMLATFHRFDPSVELPQQRVELYRGICKLQLDDRPRARGIRMLLPYERSLELLQVLALAMVVQNRSTLRREQLLNFLGKQPILRDEGVGPEAVLKQIVDVGELLVEREPGEYEFPHLSFQGFFAANQLVAQKRANVVVQNWGQSAPLWQETILFFTGQLPPRTLNQLILEVIKQGKEAAELANRCLREYRSPEKLDPQLTQDIKKLTSDVTSVIYANLEAMMQAGQWWEADRETYRLMITTVGKEEGQYLDGEDLRNFPCEDLLILDRLWVQYSRGKFGFSVQKKIYVECGATLDGEYTGNAIWDKFCDRVGWRKKDNLVSSTDLQYDPQISPQGELPFWEWRGWRGELAFSSLSRRLVNCSMSGS